MNTALILFAGIITFGYDPSNGDVLYGDNNDDQIKRLVRVTEDNTYPRTLSSTGAFAEPANLTPNPSVLGYSPIVDFWSDHTA